MKYRLMTSGPTEVRENVRLARSLEFTNPDMDPDFNDFYKETCNKLAKVVNTNSQAIIMGGEGLMGLEAACASLTEPGDRVLVIDNGIFGKGFAEFVKIYGGKPVVFTTDYHKPVSISELEAFLKRDHDFKYATMIHCDTPTGVLNDVVAMSNLLNRYGIMSVADTVAGLFGENLDMGSSSIDILCGGSQKALSAPPGLTMVWISERAFETMENRETPITGFYLNLLKYRKYDEFPYTMPISDIIGLRRALDNYFEDTNVINRHSDIAKATRKAITMSGLQLYLKDGWANTVTVINTPKGISTWQIIQGMCEDYSIMISPGLADMSETVFRIGHMGENCYRDKVAETLVALQGTLTKLGVELKCNMEEEFRRAMI